MTINRAARVTPTPEGRLANEIQMIADNTFVCEARGVLYYLRLDLLGRWELTSQRLALQGAGMGGRVRHFSSLSEVSSGVRAFKGIDQLVEAMPDAGEVNVD